MNFVKDLGSFVWGDVGKVSDGRWGVVCDWGIFFCFGDLKFVRIWRDLFFIGSLVWLFYVLSVCWIFKWGRGVGNCFLDDVISWS